MRHRLLMAIMCTALLMGVSIMPTAAQEPEPTEATVFDPACAVDLMKAYVSGWEYDHRTGGVIDVVAAAQVARNVYKAFVNVQVNCRDSLKDFKPMLLRSMHGDYPAEDVARMLGFVEEAVGTVDYNDCSYDVAVRYVQQVDWGDTTAIQVGRTISDIFRTVRAAIPGGECDGTFQIIQEMISQIDKVPPDSTLISNLYQVVGDATGGHYVSQDSCDYVLAKTFLDKVEWDGLSADQITQLVSDTFKITYHIGGDIDCNSDPALAITAMLLNDTYRFAPDASVIQNTYDAATGNVEVTPEATPIVN